MKSFKSINNYQLQHQQFINNFKEFSLTFIKNKFLDSLINDDSNTDYLTVINQSYFHCNVVNSTEFAIDDATAKTAALVNFIFQNQSLGLGVMNGDLRLYQTFFQKDSQTVYHYDFLRTQKHDGEHFLDPHDPKLALKLCLLRDYRLANFDHPEKGTWWLNNDGMLLDNKHHNAPNLNDEIVMYYQIPNGLSDQYKERTLRLLVHIINWNNVIVMNKTTKQAYVSLTKLNEYVGRNNLYQFSSWNSENFIGLNCIYLPFTVGSLLDDSNYPYRFSRYSDDKVLVDSPYNNLLDWMMYDNLNEKRDIDFAILASNKSLYTPYLFHHQTRFAPFTKFKYFQRITSIENLENIKPIDNFQSVNCHFE